MITTMFAFDFTSKLVARIRDRLFGRLDSIPIFFNYFYTECLSFACFTGRGCLSFSTEDNQSNVIKVPPKKEA